MKGWPKIPLGLRLFVLFFALLLLTAYFVFDTIEAEIKPTMRQVSEETLVDMANVLAVMALEDMKKGQFEQSRFAQMLIAFGQRQPHAQIWQVGKQSISHRIYVTDDKGIVLADSWQQDIGADYSRWNDVYLTLRGKYGARSSADPYQPGASVMHVAAPIIDGEDIIGVVTVAKTNQSVEPFITQAQNRVFRWLMLMGVVVLIIGALVAWRVNQALYKLADYAEKMGRGDKAEKPQFRVFYEYSQLSDALEKLRTQLDGKDYVEQYVQTLTHELKSPISAIKGAGEILQSPISAQKQVYFAANIEGEALRLEQLVERLLLLAKVEKQPHLQDIEAIEVDALIAYVLSAVTVKVKQKQVVIEQSVDAQSVVHAERFLLQQALINLLDNALDFVKEQGVIQIHVTQQERKIEFQIFNQGPQIPDYALPRLTERFYSLPRENGVKSSGLGLNFVEQVAKLHHGQLTIGNCNDGVIVKLTLQTP